MRWIRKRTEPRELTEWRLRYRTDVNFGYDLLRKDQMVTNALTGSLLEEQGWLCAYTGRSIDDLSCHIEHLKAQAHCVRGEGEDVSYRNLVACFPGPNYGGEYPYGAHQKKAWPAPGEEHQFLSPLEESCERRFHFSYGGKVKPANGTDEAARRTIEKLKLDHSELTDLRRAAIRGALQPNDRWLTRKQAEHLLQRYNTPARGKLPEFHFVLKQAVSNHITTLKSIRAKKQQS
jgi:uncharacterized protein (TIGR02646 family)